MFKRLSFAAVVLALAFSAHATVTGTGSNSVAYQCTGTTTAYAIPFPYLITSDIVATLSYATTSSRPLVTATEYTITPSIATSTGTLKLVSAGTCPSGYTLTITRNVPLLQPTPFRTGSYQGAKVETSFDRATMGLQQLNATHTADKAAQATKDAQQDAATTNVGNSIAALNSSSQAVTSASSVLALGTTTARTLTSRFSDTLAVKDFNAKGDGTTDDTTAIQAAVTAAAGKTLRFQPGTYKLTGVINVSSGTTIVADGAVTINQVTIGQIVFHGVSVSNIVIRGFTMTGAGSATQPITGTSNNCGAICFETGGSNITVEGNTISGFFNGITGTTLTGFTVRGNEVSHWRFYAILASQASDFHIDDNRLHDNDMPSGAAWSAATTYALGDTATSNTLMWMSLHAANLNNAPPAGPPGDTHWLQIATYGVMATGNRGVVNQARNSISFNKVYNNPMWDGIMSHDCSGLIVQGNDIRNVRNGMDLSGAGSGKYNEKLVISGNYIEDTPTDAWGGSPALNTGIFLYGPDATNKIRNVSVTGNVINGFNRFDAHLTQVAAIVATNTDGVVISANQITNTQNFAGNTVSGGIVAAALANGLVISGNSVDVTSGLAPIRMNALIADEVVVSGNVLRDGNGTGIGLNITSSSTIGVLSAVGNAMNATTPFSVSGTITTSNVDFYGAGGGTANKSLRTYTSPEGGTGCVSRVVRALGGALANVDLVTGDMTATNGASLYVVVEVTVQQTGTAGDTDVYRFRYAAKGIRNGATGVFTPTVATNMVRVDTDFASAGTAVVQPKVIWNAGATNVATLQFQPQTLNASYHISVTAQSFRGLATCL